MNHRPVYLNLLQIRLPVTGFVSILHRASGVILFLLLPGLLWVLDQSLRSEETWQSLYTALHQPWVQWVAGGFLLALVFHLLAGLRHLFMDIHIGESLQEARWSAKLVILVTVVCAIGLMAWIWRTQ